MEVVNNNEHLLNIRLVSQDEPLNGSRLKLTDNSRLLLIHNMMVSRQNGENLMQVETGCGKGKGEHPVLRAQAGELSC